MSNKSKMSKLQQQPKNKKIIILVLFLLVAAILIALSIVGIYFAAKDFINHIYNAKSICFMVFGCIGLAVGVILPLISIIIGTISSSIELKNKKITTAALEFIYSKVKPSIENITVFAKSKRVSSHKLKEKIDYFNSHQEMLEIISKSKTETGTLDLEKLIKLSKKSNINIEDVKDVLINMQ